MLTKKEFKEHMEKLLQFKKSFGKIDDALVLLSGNCDGLFNEVYRFMDLHVDLLETHMGNHGGELISNFIWFPEDCKDSNGKKITSIDKLYIELTKDSE